MSNQVLDIYKDRSLKGIVSFLRNNPSYYDQVKTAEIDYDSLGVMPETSFAWPEERLYPINNRMMSLLSAIYRNQYPPELMEEPVPVPEHVDENLKKAAYLYDLEVPGRRVKKIVKKASLKEDDFLLPEAKKFPVTGPKEALFIQNLLVKNAEYIGYNDLSQASKNLMNKMASYQVDTDSIDPIIYKYAGYTLSNKNLLSASVLRRTDFIKEGDKKEEYVSAYKKLATIIEDMDFNRLNLFKIASTLEKLDDMSKVRHLYDRHILNPIESVFNTKTIYQPQSMKTAGHDMYGSELAAITTPEQVKSILGDDVYDESVIDGTLDKQKLVDVINSLPQDMILDFVERIS